MPQDKYVKVMFIGYFEHIYIHIYIYTYIDPRRSFWKLSLTNGNVFKSLMTKQSLKKSLIMVTSTDGNIYRVIGPLLGESTGDAELWYFLWSAPERHYGFTVMVCSHHYVCCSWALWGAKASACRFAWWRHPNGKEPRKTSIRCRSYAKVMDRCLIDVDPMVFIMWDDMKMPSALPTLKRIYLAPSFTGGFSTIICQKRDFLCS